MPARALPVRPEQVQEVPQGLLAAAFLPVLLEAGSAKAGLAR